jgi:hypothetical protein
VIEIRLECLVLPQILHRVETHNLRRNTHTHTHVPQPSHTTSMSTAQTHASRSCMFSTSVQAFH